MKIHYLIIFFLFLQLSNSFGQTRILIPKYKIDGFDISSKNFKNLRLLPCQIFYTTNQYHRKRGKIIGDTITTLVLTKINFQYKNKFFHTRYAKKRLAKRLMKNGEKIDSFKFKMQSEFMKRNRLEFKYGVIIIGRDDSSFLQPMNWLQLRYREKRFFFKYAKFKRYFNSGIPN